MGDFNTVGAEYIIMERLDGIPLGEMWYTMTAKEQHKVMKQIVEWEARIMGLEFPASGSIYYQRDLSTERTVPLGDRFCIGPIAHYSWWHGERSLLDIHRGPWKSPSGIFQAVGKRELAWTQAQAKPRLPYERIYREIYNFRKSSPERHIKNLSDYLCLTPYLGSKTGSPLNRPVLRQLDFQPNNILVSESKEITGLIDWQYSSILPLSLAAGMPHHFQNYGDEESERLAKPQLDLPLDYETLPQSEQASLREILRRRLVHFLYAAFTKRLNGGHYDTIFSNSVISHQKIFKSAGTPWEGDAVSLHAEIIRFTQWWPALISAASRTACPAAPVRYSDTVIEEIFFLDERQKEADTAMETLRDAVNFDVQGWVANEEYEATKEAVRKVKAFMLNISEDDEVIAAREHFPFDDFDEDE